MSLEHKLVSILFRHWRRDYLNRQVRRSSFPLTSYCDALTTFTMATTQLLPLLTIITNAVQDIIKEYDAVHQPIPSLNSTAPGPFDSPAAMSSELLRATKIVEAACAQLSVTVANPACLMTNVSPDILCPREKARSCTDRIVVDSLEGFRSMLFLIPYTTSIPA